MGITSFLLDKENIAEAKLTETKDEVLANALKAIRPDLDVEYDHGDAHKHTSLANLLLTLYSKSEEVAWEDIDVHDVSEWVDAYGGYGGVVLDFVNDPKFLSNPGQFVGLAKLDPKFIKAIKDYAVSIGLLTKRGKGLDDKGNFVELKDAQIVGDVLDTMNRVAIRDINGDKLKTPMEKGAKITYVDKDGKEKTATHDDELSPEYLRDTLKEIKPFYTNALNESENTEPVVDGTIPETEVPTEEPSTEVVKAAHSDMINNLINEHWNLISSLNSVIASVEYDFPGNKEDIVSLLNDIVDSTTINIGMLHKISSLTDAEQAELINQGEAKAEEKIGE